MTALHYSQFATVASSGLSAAPARGKLPQPTTAPKTKAMRLAKPAKDVSRGKMIFFTSNPLNTSSRFENGSLVYSRRERLEAENSAASTRTRRRVDGFATPEFLSAMGILNYFGI
jgi:hypothetical protein